MDTKEQGIKNRLKLDSNMSMVYVAVALLAFVFFALLYGVRILNPTYDGWLFGQYYIRLDAFYGRDLTQHYIGWQGYRASDWTFPLGNFDALSSPYSMSIIFTDSIPLLAVIFKLFRGILPRTFQYFGFYGLFCFVMQGIMSVRILRHYIDDKKQLIISSILFATAPVVVWRMFMHTALDSQWLILMALEAVFAPHGFDFKKMFKHFLLVGFLCASIHIYLFFYCGVILCAAILAQLIIDKKNAKYLLIVPAYVIVAVIVIGLLGGFSSHVDSSLGTARYFTMNLNSFYDSYGYSFILPSQARCLMPVLNSEVQFEGYAYLGVGVILLLIISVVLFGTKGIWKRLSDKKTLVISLAVLWVVALILALSPTVTFNDKVLIDIPLPEIIENAWAIFRATGRASWILVYIVMAASIIVLSKALADKSRLTIMFLTSCVIIQLMDNFKLYSVVSEYFHNDIYESFYYSTYLPSDFWDSIDNDRIKHIVFANTTTPYDDEVKSFAFEQYLIGPSSIEVLLIQYAGAQLAIKNDCTFNYFRFSRHFYNDAREEYYRIINEESNLDEYVFIYDTYNKLQAAATGLNVYYADGLYVAYSGELDPAYKISNRDIVYRLDCMTQDNSGSILQGGSYQIMDILEVPSGEYYCQVETSNPYCINLAFINEENSLEYTSELVSIEGTRSTFRVMFADEYYDAGIAVGNMGASDEQLYSIKLWPAY